MTVWLRRQGRRGEPLASTVRRLCAHGREHTAALLASVRAGGVARRLYSSYVSKHFTVRVERLCAGARDASRGALGLCLTLCASQSASLVQPHSERCSRRVESGCGHVSAPRPDRPPPALSTTVASTMSAGKHSMSPFSAHTVCVCCCSGRS